MWLLSWKANQPLWCQEPLPGLPQNQLHFCLSCRITVTFTLQFSSFILIFPRWLMHGSLSLRFSHPAPKDWPWFFFLNFLVSSSEGGRKKWKLCPICLWYTCSLPQCICLFLGVLWAGAVRNAIGASIHDQKEGFTSNKSGSVCVLHKQ